MTVIAVGLSNERAGSRALVYLSLLSIAAVYFLAFPIWRATFFVEIWPTESWNAYWQDAAAKPIAGARAMSALFFRSSP